MGKQVFLLLFLAVILINPVFSDSYIITPPSKNLDRYSKTLETPSENNFDCRPIYGSKSCVAELNEKQLEALREQGYEVSPNLKVYAFLDQSVSQIRANEMWEITESGENLTGKGQTVCVIDTGIDYNHSALGGNWSEKVIAGSRFLGNGTNVSECNLTDPSPCYDDHGHGTHCAGIITSTNETYKGVAPDTKLVAVKALDSSGSGWLSDIISGINYCTNYSEEYNISVISMSLGTLYTNSSYCDNVIPSLTSAIDNATSKNISVVAASGNSGANGISIPACIENATPVGSVNSYDSISYFSNYWNLSQIFAPGENIYSTYPNGWKSMSGTSMATPHVAGAYALIAQYLELDNQTKTPQELEALFVRNGITIDSNTNHSRIDVYNTYINLSKDVFLSSPNLNFSLQPGETKTRTFSITSETNKNFTFSFTNLSNTGGEISNSNIFAWVQGNTSQNSTGNETLSVNNVSDLNLSVNLTAPSNISGIYIGTVTIGANNATESTTLYVNLNADILYKTWKKILFSGCKTINSRVEIEDIVNTLIIEGNFSNSTSSSIYFKNSTSGLVVENNSKTQVTENSLQVDNPPSGIFDIVVGCGGEESGNVTQTTSFSGGEISANWLIAVSSLNTSQEEINLSLNANSQTSSSFNLSTNSTEENVSLSTGNSYLVYTQNDSISNGSYSNFTFIIPHSNNLSANLSWTNSSNELNLSLTNLRTGATYSNNSGSTPSVLDLNSSQVSYGIWKASVFGANVSGNETFNLTIKLLDNRFKTNFTEVTHKFKNKTVGNSSTTNWSFYVDNSVNSINISLATNGTNTTTLYLYNSTNLSTTPINSTNTSNGAASLSTADISDGYWTVLINNTHANQSRDYNLTIELQGNDIRELGNLTNQSSSTVNFNITSPANKVVDRNYNTVIIITATSVSQNINLNLDLSTPILKLTPSWKGNNYIGDQNLSASTTESYNLTRNFYININQSKTFNFLINNTGSLDLTNLTQTDSTNLTKGNLTLNFTNIALQGNVSSGTTGYFNVTIESPENSSYIGSYRGWIYLNSTNGQPFNYLNLSLNVTVTNQTLNQINNSFYYFPNPNIGFNISYYDNRSLTSDWGSGNYSLNLTNSTGNITKQVNFIASNGFFSGTLDTTNLTEGNYTLGGTIYDLVNNKATINSTFELLHNLDLSITVPDSTIIKDENFIFSVNVSKLGSVIAENVSVCLETPSNITNSSALCNSSVGNITPTNATLLNWTLSGTSRGTYDINVTAYSSDGRFNETTNQSIQIKYGYLTLAVDADTPSSQYINTSFTVYIDVTNDGTLKASNVTTKIRVCGSTKTTDCTNEYISSGGNLNECDATFSCSSTGDKDIDVKLIGVQNATCSWGSCDSFTTVGNISIASSSDGDGSSGGGDGTSTNYDVLFEEPTFPKKMSIKQGGSNTLAVRVKNTGNSELENGYLRISGIDSSAYTIDPSDKSDLAVGNYLNYNVIFEIPPDLEAKTYVVWLNFISDQYSEKRGIEITVLNLELEINLTDIEIVQGATKSYKFSIENTGNSTLNNLELNLSGINKGYFNLSPTTIDSLAENEETSVNLNLSIPRVERIGEKDLNLMVTTNEKNFSKELTLTINPCEEEKENINNQYLELLSKYENLTKDIEAAKNEGRNVSSLEQQLKTLNNSLTKIKDYLDQGKYIEAKNELESASSTFATLSTELQEKEAQKEEGPLLLIVIIALVTVLLGIILAYTYIIPKKRADIRKSYKYKGGTFDNIKNTINSLLGSLTKKISRRKSQDEVLRKKKLKEWRKYYDELKKKKYGK